MKFIVDLDKSRFDKSAKDESKNGFKRGWETLFDENLKYATYVSFVL